MPVRFKSKDLRPVIDCAMTRQCRLVLVKNYGVYFMSEGDEGSGIVAEPIAYAVGFNPAVTPSEVWCPRADKELGGDDFCEYFDPKDDVFACVLAEGFDLIVSASGKSLSLLVPSKSA